MADSMVLAVAVSSNDSTLSQNKAGVVVVVAVPGSNPLGSVASSSGQRSQVGLVDIGEARTLGCAVGNSFSVSQGSGTNLATIDGTNSSEQSEKREHIIGCFCRTNNLVVLYTLTPVCLL